jgi:hypothetical protein
MRLDETFGFLEAADGHEIYFHKNIVLNDGFSRLVPGSHGKAAWPPRPAMMRTPRARQLWPGRRPFGLVPGGRRTMLKT